jgi:predicted secreted Zn-dependent protease
MSKTPTYYIGKTLGIEAKDVVMDFQPDNYNIGTALTYLMRAGKKPNNPITQDIKKAIAHLEFELDRQRKQEIKDEQSGVSTTSETINVKYAVLY